jgi:hypothetical protein
MEKYTIYKRFSGKVLHEGLDSEFKAFCMQNKANLTDANLTGANLRRANLTGANLRRANLTDADLTGANLTDADLTGANLTDADLTGADLTDADLTDADLTGANLTDADLTGANLTDADLTGADLTDADLTDADLTGANLTDADLPIFCYWHVSFIQPDTSNPVLVENILIKIGCKTKTLTEWDNWFNNSTKTFDHKRDSDTFKRIRANFKAMKAYLIDLFSEENK